MNSKKKLAVVSGGTGYLGSAIVKTFREKMWNVAILSRKETNDPDVYKCDITREQDVRDAIEKIVSKYGEIDAVIHAASPPLERIPLLSTPVESFERTLNTAVRGAFFLAKTSIDHMTASSTFIGFTSQAISQNSKSKNLGAYIPAKFALQGLIKVLSAELALKGIRVYAISPGFLPGGLNNDLPQRVKEFFTPKVHGVPLSESDIAGLVVDICMNKSEFPSGSTIQIP